MSELALRDRDPHQDNLPETPWPVPQPRDFSEQAVTPEISDAVETVTPPVDTLEVNDAREAETYSLFEEEIARMQSVANTKPYTEEFPAGSFPAQEVATITESPKRGLVAKLLRKVESLGAKAGEKATTVETDGVKALVRRTGRSAVEATEKSSPLEPGISNNKISRFIDKMGINSDEARANDGLLLKKLSKESREAAKIRKQERKEARAIAKKEKNFVDYDEAYDQAAAQELENYRAQQLAEARDKALDAYEEAAAKVEAVANNKIDEKAKALGLVVEASNIDVDVDEPEVVEKMSRKDKKDAKKAAKNAGSSTSGGGGYGASSGENKKEATVFDKALGYISNRSR
jgi:hypothetical protein